MRRRSLANTSTNHPFDALNACSGQAYHFSPPSLKGLSHHLFTLLPQGGGQLRIEGIPAYAFANGANGHIVCYNMADMAILAVFPTNLVSPRHNPGPY